MDRKYTPNLAEFYFKPDEDWSDNTAREMYDRARFEIPVNVIYYEDCIRGLARIPDVAVDCAVADPPFALSFSGKEHFYNRNANNVADGYVDIHPDDYPAFSREWISQVQRVLKETGSAWIFSGWSHLRDVLNAVYDSGLHLVNLICWNYNFNAFTSRKFASSHYHILFCVKSLSKYYWNKVIHYPLDVWHDKRDFARDTKKNATKLPYSVVKRCLDFTTRPGDLVLDPFMGNGTTAVASKSSLRHFVGFEMNRNARPIIEKSILMTEPGDKYATHKSRLPSLRELAKMYPRAYLEFTKRNYGIDKWIKKTSKSI